MGDKITRVRQQQRPTSTPDQRFTVGNPSYHDDTVTQLQPAEFGVNVVDGTLEIGINGKVYQIPLLEANAAADTKASVWNEATKKWVFGAVGGGGTYANVLFVSASGNNGTAIIGDSSKPYLNIVNAVDAASSGDTIYQIGNQTVSTGNGNLAKNGVNYIIQGNLTSTLNESLFDDDGSAVIININCTGTIRQQDSALASPMFKITHADSKFTVNTTLLHADSMISDISDGEFIHYGTMQSDKKNVALIQGGATWYHEGLIIHKSENGSGFDYALSVENGVSVNATQIGDMITFTKGATGVGDGIIRGIGNDVDSNFSFSGKINCNGTGNNGSDSHLLFYSGSGNFVFDGEIYAKNIPSIFWFRALEIGANVHLKLKTWKALGDSTYARGVFEDRGAHPEDEGLSVIIDANGCVKNGIFARVGSNTSFPRILKGRVFLEAADDDAHGIVLLGEGVILDGMTVIASTLSSTDARSVTTLGVDRDVKIYSGGFQSNIEDENTDTPGRIVTQIFTNHYLVGDGDVQ